MMKFDDALEVVDERKKYNVQIAVDTKNHLIVAYETTNIGNDRSQLFRMSALVQQAMGKHSLTTIADKGYYSAA